MFVDLGTYELALVVIGLAALGAVVLPRVLSDRPMSFPIIYVLFGVGVFLTAPAEGFDPKENVALVERISEATVIVALMGLGLKIDRPLGWRTWAVTRRLLAVTMPLTIAAAALLGYWALGWPLATALLLGAVIAPTDPVLARDVQTSEPQMEDEGRVRFALSSEAGLNDGLAFPFTYLAVGVALAGFEGDMLIEWFAVALVMKIALGAVIGWAIGRGIAFFVFERPVGESRVAQTAEGIVAIAVTLLAYGLAETAQGYGFIAVFVAAITIRHYEREHDYHQVLHRFADQIERLLIAVFLTLLGGGLVSGLLEELTWRGAVVAFVLLLVVRPAAGWIGLVGAEETRPARAIISAFGIRGVGSFFYLAYGLEQADFPHADEVWAVVALVVIGSIVIHGITANPVMDRFDRWRQELPAA